jgi:hypothetical protein
MVTIAGCFFVDHPDGSPYRFPVGLIADPLRAFDAVRMFAGDEAGAKWMTEEVDRRLGVKIPARSLDCKIKTPYDIPRAQNKVRQAIFEEGFDFAALIQADLMMTPVGVAQVREYCTQEHVNFPVLLFTQQIVRMYCMGWTSSFGTFAIGRGSPCVFDENADGAHPVQHFDALVRAPASLEVGYFTIRDLWAHHYQNLGVWGLQDGRFLKNSMDDVQAFLPGALEWIKGDLGKLEIGDPEEPSFKKALDYFNARDEYEMMKKHLNLLCRR